MDKIANFSASIRSDQQAGPEPAMKTKKDDIYYFPLPRVNGIIMLIYFILSRSMCNTTICVIVKKKLLQCLLLK